FKMLKIPPKINWFSSEQSWLLNREKTFFKSIEEVDKFHQIALCKKNLRINPSSNLPIKKEIDCKSIFRSGTTSISSNREYHYSMPEFDIMNQHHIWKIEKLHNLEKEGNVIWIAASSYDLKKDSIYGPSNYIATGKQNNTYNLMYNQNYEKKDWEHNLNLALSYKPKFVRTSPSTIEAIYYHLGKNFKFDCPVILSEETLHSNVRRMSDEIFTKTIDKMVGWDGCLGWYECEHKTKHIYDEFCYVEQLEDDVLAVTDLHNRTMEFTRYLIGDRGKLNKKKCECGISGNYFEEFQGKTIECLFSNNTIIPGRYISEKISILFRLGYEFQGEEKISFDDYIIYRIRQLKNTDIEFVYSARNEFKEDQKLKIKNMLEKLTNCKIFFTKEDFPCFQRKKKNLFIESECARDFWNNKRI
ncbi:MAG: hypothetical protein WCG45_05795, partial [bacterium]